jgi:hypothetical protein
MDQIAPRMKAPRDRLGEDYWEALARDAERGLLDPVAGVRIEIDGLQHAPDRIVAAALRDRFRVPPNGLTLTASDIGSIEFIAAAHHEKPEIAEQFVLISDAICEGARVRLVYDC